MLKGSEDRGKLPGPCGRTHSFSIAREVISQANETRCSLNTFLVCLFSFLGPYLWHMEIPRQGAELELHLRPKPQL